MTKGDLKSDTMSIIDAAVPGDDTVELSDANKSDLCQNVVAYHVDTVNPDKGNYPKIKFKNT